MNNEEFPIAVFVYNRPEHAQRLFASLAACHGLEKCAVHIYCDGPSKATHVQAVAATRKVVQDWAPLLRAAVTCRDENLGLARSIVSGVAQLCTEYGKVIVLEDDLILTKGF